MQKRTQKGRRRKGDEEEPSLLRKARAEICCALRSAALSDLPYVWYARPSTFR